MFFELIKKFACTFELCSNNAQKFMLLLRKGVYAYEYMDSMDKFNEKELPIIDKFYSIVLVIVILGKMIRIMQKRYGISLK